MTFKQLSDYNDILLQEDWRSNLAALGLVGGGLAGDQPLDQQPPAVTPPAVVQPAAQPAAVSPIQDTNFIAYVKNAENAAFTGRKSNGVWFQHPSSEPGTDTIGYGHKIKKGEDFSQGRTDAQIDALLMKDLKDAENIVITKLANLKLGTDAYNKLLKEYPAGVKMFIDLAFNIGPNFAVNGHPEKLDYPKFTQGVLTRDMNLMRAEYHRKFFNKKTQRYEMLTRRNKLFYDYFLK